MRHDNDAMQTKSSFPRPSDETLRAIVKGEPGSKDDALFYATSMAFELLARRQEDAIISDVIKETFRLR